MRRAIIRELKKKLRRKGLRKFELADGSFQELGAGGAPGGVAELLQAPESWKGGILKLREALTRAFLDAQSVNPNAQDFCWCSWVEVLGTDGG